MTIKKSKSKQSNRMKRHAHKVASFVLVKNDSDGSSSDQSVERKRRMKKEIKRLVRNYYKKNDRKEIGEE